MTIHQIRGRAMNANHEPSPGFPLRTKSLKFGVRMINLNHVLRLRRVEYAVRDQLLRSGTAIGALVREAEQAESNADFIHKLAVALKEANETEYWMILLMETNHLSPAEFDSLHKDVKELLKLLTSIINACKRKKGS